MRQSVTIVLDHPPKGLRSNGGHGNVWAKARAIKAYRNYAKSKAIATLGMDAPPCWVRARVWITWRSRTLIAPDPTNIINYLKAAFDGLQDAGIVENDRGLWPERPRIETRASWSEVVITVEEDTDI